MFSTRELTRAFGRPAGTRADLDLDIPAPLADAFLPVAVGDALSTTYATVIAQRIDADAADDLSYRARSASERFDIDADEVTAGDETSVTVDTEPRTAFVVFNDGEVLYREPLDGDS